VAEGLLGLDEEAALVGEGITIRQLLNHTSGLDDAHADLMELFEPYRNNLAHRFGLGHREQLEQVLQKPRLFAPGEGWAYHGANYLALGLIVEETTGMSLRDALRERILAPLGLESTDLVDGPLYGECARGYIPAHNPILPGADGHIDVTEIDLPFNWAGGGVVSTAGEVATMLRAQLGGDLLPDDLRTEMLTAVDSDWPETDRYGLGIGEINSIWRRERSTCGPAWGHLGFSLGYMAIALSSADGERQVVLLANWSFMTEESENAFFDAAGRLIWHLYCT
jgi:D-alanyl-D-alanine carboxypeptidase